MFYSFYFYLLSPFRSKSNLTFGIGPALVAADNFDNKIYAVTKDQFYTPLDSRNRLSINWDPDSRKSEPEGPVNVSRVGWSKLELKR